MKAPPTISSSLRTVALTSSLCLLALGLATCSSPAPGGELGVDARTDGARDTTATGEMLRDVLGRDDTPRDGSVPGESAPPPPDGPGPAGVFREVPSFGSNPGALHMFTYVPATMPTTKAPLVVALHGCKLTATDYAAATGWNDLADRDHFYVLYPQQSTANNPLSCFNWFEPGDATRGQGEALSIVQMVDQMIRDHPIDPKRVFVTGLSAGAAMTVALGAAYPDRFAGLAPIAGVPTGCATNAVAAMYCMMGIDKLPKAWGDAARQADPSFAKAYPRIVIFHGMKDPTVAFSNLNEIMEQWTDLHGTDTIPDVSDTLSTHPHRVYRDKQGVSVVETFAIQGMKHGVPVDPGTGISQGGKTSWFSFDVDLWSSYEAAKFWGL